MTDIEEFIKSEEQKMTWLDKLVMNYPKVIPTSSVSKFSHNKAFPEQTTIKPSLWSKLFQ